MNINTIKEFMCITGEFDGSGVKIAVIENSWSAPTYSEFEFPFDVSRFPGGQDKNVFHNYASAWTVKQIAPRAEIYVLPPTFEAFAWCYNNDVDVVSMSLSRSIAGPIIESKLNEKAFLVCAAGNSGEDLDHYESEASQTGFYCPVGATQYNNGNPIIKTYSSYGLGKVKTCGIDEFEAPYYGTFNGTSACAPQISAIVALFIEWFKLKYKTKPSVKLINKYIRKASKDINVPGFDLKTGFGVLIQNFEESMFDVSKISVGNNTGFKNGKKFKMINAPEIKNSKTMVELTVLRQNNASVGWDDGNVYIIT